MGVDGGSQSSKVVIFDLEGNIVCEGKEDLRPMNLGENTLVRCYRHMKRLPKDVYFAYGAMIFGVNGKNIITVWCIDQHHFRPRFAHHALLGCCFYSWRYLTKSSIVVINGTQYPVHFIAGSRC